MKKIKKGDQVIIIAGKDKGKKGTISKVLSNGKVLVDGLNTVKKHVKANPDANIQGGISIKEKPLDASNVMLFDTSSEKGSRVGIKFMDDGHKVRYFKDSGEVVDI